MNKERVTFLLFMLFLFGLLLGCSNPNEPYIMPPCKWIHLYDSNGKNSMDVLAPGQMIGVVITCDKAKPRIY
jgi:hypothetical protein